MATCKACSRERSRLWRKAHPENVREAQAKWRKKVDYKAQCRRRYHAKKVAVVQAGARRGQYLDKKWFTTLFSDTITNHSAIATSLNLIAQGIAKSFFNLHESDKDEVTQVGVTAGLKQIAKFDQSKGFDAFGYFSTIILNAIKKHLVVSNNRQMVSLDATNNCQE